MHILIIGAAGMVGRKLTERLVRDKRLGSAPIDQLTLVDVVAPDKPQGGPPPGVAVGGNGRPNPTVAMKSGIEGREKEFGEAVGVLNLDNAPPPEAMTEMLAGPDILSASVIRLPKAGQLPAWLGG